MSAPLALALESVTRPRHRWPWGFWGRFTLGTWYGLGLYLMLAESEFVRPWLVVTAIVGMWWAFWRALVALVRGD